MRVEEYGGKAIADVETLDATIIVNGRAVGVNPNKKAIRSTR